MSKSKLYEVISAGFALWCVFEMRLHCYELAALAALGSVFYSVNCAAYIIRACLIKGNE